MNRQFLALLVLLTLLAAGRGQSQEDLPKVVLIGDSIRMDYSPVVSKRLEGKARVFSPSINGGDSSNVLKHLDEWIIAEKPDVIHLNCGLHDLKVAKETRRHQVPIASYEANLRTIIARIRKGTSAALVFANTTPIHNDRHALRKAGFDRYLTDVQEYNAVAQRVMREAGVPIHDLHGLVMDGDYARMLDTDGTHFTEAANERVAAAVTDCVLRHLSVVRYKPLATQRGGAEAASAYRKDEAQRDAQVPRAFKEMRFGEFRLPGSATDWKTQRPGVLKLVQESLGDLPPRPDPSRVRLVSREFRSGYTVERVGLENGVDGEVSALVLIPEKRTKPAPAVLWLHSSTPDKNQILTPNTNGGKESLGEVFVRAGYVVMSPDAYWHGDRVGTGPAGMAEPARGEQESLHKLNLWMGRTLWGMFVRDDQVALDYLCRRPEVDRTRIGATGMSMGSTRAWWLAAVDERIHATVGVACLTRYENLIRHGQLRAHGVYYFTYGLLKHFDIEGVLSLIAPRPYLALTGDLDAGSPADGIKIIEDRLGKVYRTLGAEDRFRNVLYPDVGHTYTPEMREEMLAWFARWLQRR